MVALQSVSFGRLIDVFVFRARSKKSSTAHAGPQRLSFASNSNLARVASRNGYLACSLAAAEAAGGVDQAWAIACGFSADRSLIVMSIS